MLTTVKTYIGLSINSLVSDFDDGLRIHDSSKRQIYYSLACWILRWNLVVVSSDSNNVLSLLAPIPLLMVLIYNRHVRTKETTTMLLTYENICKTYAVDSR